jgi:hypothetical protein
MVYEKMNCKGCRTLSLIYEYNIERKKCILKTVAPTEECPCWNCLIKTTCFKQCDDFIELLEFVFEMKLSYDYKCVLKPDSTYYYGVPKRAYYKSI